MLSDKTEVRQVLCGETRFVEQEHLRWSRVAVSGAVMCRVQVSVSSSPSCPSAEPENILPVSSWISFLKKTADDLFSEADCFKLSQVINKLKDAGESRRHRERQILAGFNWNNISHGGVVLFPLAIAMFHFMPPCALLFPTFPLCLYLPSTPLANQ